MNIEETAWAKQFKAGAPGSYLQALYYAGHDFTYSIQCVDDLYAVVVNDDASEDDFWMDAFSTPEAALALCAEMGWRVVD